MEWDKIGMDEVGWMEWDEGGDGGDRVGLDWTRWGKVG